MICGWKDSRPDKPLVVTDMHFAVLCNRFICIYEYTWCSSLARIVQSSRPLVHINGCSSMLNERALIGGTFYSQNHGTFEQLLV
jgi:hypothetical protein